MKIIVASAGYKVNHRRHRSEVEAEIGAIVRTRVLATGERLLKMAIAWASS
jgi:hypothetical protein